MSLAIELAAVLAVDPDQDTLPLITVGLYRVFLAKGRHGLEALQVYQHLLFSYRLQRTDTVQATNTYLQRGLHLGRNRIESAKVLLREMGVIGKPIRKRDEKGQVLKGQVYVKLNLLPNPGPSIAPESGDMEKSLKKPIAPENHTHGSGREMLEEERREEQPTAEAKPTASSSPAKSKKAKTPHGRSKVLFSELYRKKTGAASSQFNAVCAGQLKNDLARLGEDKLARCLQWLFESPPARMKSFAYMALHTFLPEAEKALESEERRLRLLKTCKHCGKASETSGIDCPKCGEPDAYQVREARHA